MGPPLPESLAALFDQVAQLPRSERDARMADLGQSAPSLAAEVRSLLAMEGSAGDFLAVLDESSDRPDPVAPGQPVPAAGQRLGPYRLVRPVGRGGMGVVWLAVDERLRRQVAVKIFSARGAALARGEARTRMLVEARAAGVLDHPNVAAVYDIGETPDGITFLAMPYCEGGSLADRLVAGPLDLDRALGMAGQLALALGAAHERGIVHRDVKPGNVLFDASDQVRLADFGIAATPDRAGPGGLEGLGTLAYMAPEQLSGRPVDHRADLWSLGVTLYQAITGRRPFGGTSRASLLYQIVAGRPDRMGAPVAAAPEAEALVLRLLEKDPEHRPRNAAELTRDLDRARSAVQARRWASAPPCAPTPMIGRVGELARAISLLNECRLVTLTGPGGTGKTRLALEIAARLDGTRAGGICFVSLAAVASSALVPNAVAGALGLRERGASGMAEQVLRHCAGLDLLLVLDNCEHLPDAALFVAALLARAPRVTVLATSRSPLAIRGEQVLPVPPLVLPDAGPASPESVRDAEAVRLFAQRAGAVLPDFAVSDHNAAEVAAICRRLDGLPLAIELAAARVTTLSPAALLARLQASTDWLRSGVHDRPERHRTLHTAIGWSYGLLEPAEQELLRVLSVFVGGFGESDARAVLGGSAGSAPTAGGGDLLDSLVSKHLVVVRLGPDGAARFDLLQTIHDFALQELRASGVEPAVRLRHAGHQVTAAEAAAGRLRGPDQAACHARLREDHHNARAALEYLVAAGELPLAARLAVALHRHWLVSCSFLRDIVDQLTELDRRIRERADHRGGPALHGDLLMVLGSLTGISGVHQDVPHAHYEAGLATYRLAGDVAGEARALNHVGWSAMVLGRSLEARAFSARALAMHRERGDAGGIATSLVNLGWVALSRGLYADAEASFADALAIQRALGDRRSIAYALGHLGTVAFYQGDTALALVRYHETMVALEPLDDRIVGSTFGVRRALAVHAAMTGEPVLEPIERAFLPGIRDVGHAWSLGYGLGVLGRIRLDRGDLDGARAALDESLAVRRASGLEPGIAESEALLGETALRAGDATAAAPLLASSLITRQAIEEPLGVVESVEAIAALLLARGDAESALTLLAGARAARRRLGAAILPRYRPGLDALGVEAEARLDPDTALRAGATGAGLTPEQLGALALHRLVP